MTTRMTIMTAILSLAAAPAIAQPRQATAEQRAAANAALARWTSPALARFGSERDFERFLRDTQSAAQTRPRGEDDNAILIVEGRVVARSPEAAGAAPGVREGDTIGQAGRFLLILRDGRLYSIDTGAGVGAALRLADRATLYEDAPNSLMFDELLVRGNRIIVSGVNVNRLVARLSFFTLGPDGRLTREGDFGTPSQDGNRAMLAGDRLVLYTRLRPSAYDRNRRFVRPLIRPWPAPEWKWRADGGGRPLPPVQEIYRPLVSTYFPSVHIVSVCPLAAATADAIDCRSTAFAGASAAIFHVSATDAFLMLAPDEADQRGRVDPGVCASDWRRELGLARSIAYRIPLGGGAPTVLAVPGWGWDEHMLRAEGDRLNGLLDRQALACPGGSPEGPILFSVPLSAFGPLLRQADASTFLAMPFEAADRPIMRAIGRRLLYAHRDPGAETGEAVFFDPARLNDLPLVDLPYRLLRGDQAGRYALLTGATDLGLHVSLVDPEGEPRLLATVHLPGRAQEGEDGYLAAARIGADGSGLVAVPSDVAGADAPPPAEIAFFAVDRAGRMAPIGTLARDFGASPPITDYECAASCGYWPPRAIFMGDRIFALTGAELIEGRVGADGRIAPVGRINMLRAAAPRSR